MSELTARRSRFSIASERDHQLRHVQVSRSQRARRGEPRRDLLPQASLPGAGCGSNDELVQGGRVGRLLDRNVRERQINSSRYLPS